MQEKNILVCMFLPLQKKQLFRHTYVFIRKFQMWSHVIVSLWKLSEKFANRTNRLVKKISRTSLFLGQSGYRTFWTDEIFEIFPRALYITNERMVTPQNQFLLIMELFLTIFVIVLLIKKIFIVFVIILLE